VRATVYIERLEDMAQKRWIVTTSGDRPVADVKRDLTEAGFSVTDVMDAIGCIGGSASDDVIRRIRSLPGVTDVSPDAAIDVGPPDDPETW
jgi:hypothetical protein